MSYMKWFAATVMVSAALAAVGCQSQSSNGEANKCSPCATKSGCSAKTVAMYDVTVDGMSWGVSWVKKVKETLSRLDGVDKVDVDFGKKLAMVTMKTGKELDKATVEKAIKDSGFSVSAFGKKSG